MIKSVENALSIGLKTKFSHVDTRLFIDNALERLMSMYDLSNEKGIDIALYKSQEWVHYATEEQIAQGTIIVNPDLDYSRTLYFQLPPKAVLPSPEQTFGKKIQLEKCPNCGSKNTLHYV